MLATGSTDGRGFVGKVGDFGLSLQMNHLETHISSVYQVRWRLRDALVSEIWDEPLSR